jgi:hypothetical protein
MFMYMVDLPSTTLGWNRESTGQQNMLVRPGQTFNGTQRKLLKTS